MIRLACALGLFLVLLSPRVVSAQPVLPTKESPDLFAVIQIDATRVKYISAKVWMEKKKVVFEFQDPKSKKTSAGVLKNDKLTTARLEETAKTVSQAYHFELCRKLGVPADRIFLVASSHFWDLPEDQKKAFKDKILAAIEKQAPAGWKNRPDRPEMIPFQILSPKEELEFTWLGLQDRGDDPSTYIVASVGLGPPIAGYFSPERGSSQNQFRGLGEAGGLPGALKLTDSMQTKLLKEGTINKPQDFPLKFSAGLPSVFQSEIAEPLFDETKGLAGFRNRKIHYLSGDAADAMLAIMKPKALLEKSNQVSITPTEIQDFAKLTLANKNKDGSLDLPEPKEKGDSDEEKIIQSFYNDVVQDTFTPEQLAVAAATLQSVSETFRYNDKKEIVILKDAGHAWPTAFLRKAAEQTLKRVAAAQPKK